MSEEEMRNEIKSMIVNLTDIIGEFVQEAGGCEKIFWALAHPTHECPIKVECMQCEQGDNCAFYQSAKDIYLPEPETAREYHVYLYTLSCIIRGLERILGL